MVSSILDELSRVVERNRDTAIYMLQDLVNVPSLSGQEAALAKLLADKMTNASFDTVRVDHLSNVMGTIKGSGEGRDTLFNGHIDHVPPGNMIDPYSGKIIAGAPFGVEDKVVYGRAASDMKGAVAAMVMAGRILNELGVELRGDFKVAGVVQEEVSGAGTISTIQENQFLGDVIVIGEATNMELALGHRGGARTEVIVKGRSCHASAPERGVNALYKATEIISKIRSDLIPRLPEHHIFGKTSIAVTKISVKPDIQNVVPEECRFHLDVRNTPNYSAETLHKDLISLIDSLKHEDNEINATIIPSQLIKGGRNFSGFYTDPKKNPIVNEIKLALMESLDKNVDFKVWTFATDGRFYSWMGLPVIGFGPGEERFAHTNQDHVGVEDYIQTIKAYAWIACKICGINK
jgi:putative selenium metabolism hydrolase